MIGNGQKVQQAQSNNNNINTCEHRNPKHPKIQCEIEDYEFDDENANSSPLKRYNLQDDLPMNTIKICDGLYIGTFHCLQDVQMLQSNYITHLIQVIKPLSNSFKSNAQKQTFPVIISDVLEYQLENYKLKMKMKQEISIQDIRGNCNVQAKNQLIEYIEQARELGQSCLFYQPLGLNSKDGGIRNSATVAAEFLMLRYSWSLSKTLQFINLRLSALSKSMEILKEAQSKQDENNCLVISNKVSASQLSSSPQILLDSQHLQITQLMLLKSHRTVSYNWQLPENQQNIDPSQLLLRNTFLNSAKNLGLCSYLGLLREDSLKKTRKNIKLNKNTSLSRISDKQNSEKDLGNVKNKMFEKVFHNKSTDSILKISENINNQNISKLQPSRLPKQPNASENSKKKYDLSNNISKKLKKVPIPHSISSITCQSSQSLRNSINKGNHKALKMGQSMHLKNKSLAKSVNNQNDFFPKPILKTCGKNRENKSNRNERIKWAEELIHQHSSSNYFEIEQKKQLSKKSDPKAKIILSVMELIGKQKIGQSGNQTQPLNNPKNNPFSLNKKRGMINKKSSINQSKLRLQTIHDLPNSSLRSQKNPRKCQTDTNEEDTFHNNNILEQKNENQQTLKTFTISNQFLQKRKRSQLAERSKSSLQQQKNLDKSLSISDLRSKSAIEKNKAVANTVKKIKQMKIQKSKPLSFLKMRTQHLVEKVLKNDQNQNLNMNQSDRKLCKNSDLQIYCNP